jgi:murein DD-endopeptidase MepM/ murein hydrolase activator NlpD
VTHGRAGALAAGVLLALLASAALPAAGLTVRVLPDAPRPGDVVLFQVEGAPADLAGEWNGRPLAFFPVPGGLAALVGVDLDTPVAPLAWRLVQPMASGGPLVVGAGSVRVHPRHFETQHLTLPPGQVDLDPKTLARVRAEQAEMATALGASAGERLWQGAFQQPIDGGRATGGFGLRRIINRQPRSPHSGYDWAASRGTPVLAANAGRVVLVAEHFFPGRLVVLDHGLGLFTLYFHLDETRVAPDEQVRRGQSIGTVGATGRATGPHLHFGVTLGGARVDPLTLLALVPPDGS